MLDVCLGIDIPSTSNGRSNSQYRSLHGHKTCHMTLLSCKISQGTVILQIKMIVFNIFTSTPEQGASSGSSPHRGRNPRQRSSRIPSPIGGGDRRYSPSIHTNRQEEDSGVNQNVPEQLVISLVNTGDTVSVVRDTSSVAVAESSSNTQTSQQTPASSATEEANHPIPSSSVNGPQTTGGPAATLSADSTGQGAVEELTTVPEASRGTASVSVSDQDIQTEIDNTTMGFLENASPPSTTRASSGSSTSGTTQTSYDVHPIGETSAANEPCQECIELKKRISLLEAYHEFQQQSQWETTDILTNMVEEKDHQTSERMDHIENRLENVSADLQKVARERDKYEIRATYLQGKLSGHHRPRDNARRAQRFTNDNRHSLSDFAACIQKMTAQLKDIASQLTASPHPEVQKLRHEQQIDAESNTNTDSRRLHLHQLAEESRTVMRNNADEKEVAVLWPNDIQSPQEQEQGTSSEVATSHTEQPKTNTVTTAQQEALSNTNRRSKVLDSNTRSKAKVKRERKPQSRCVKLEVINRRGHRCVIFS